MHGQCWRHPQHLRPQDRPHGCCSRCPRTHSLQNRKNRRGQLSNRAAGNGVRQIGQMLRSSFSCGQGRVRQKTFHLGDLGCGRLKRGNQTISRARCGATLDQLLQPHFVAGHQCCPHHIGQPNFDRPRAPARRGKLPEPAHRGAAAQQQVEQDCFGLGFAGKPDAIGTGSAVFAAVPRAVGRGLPGAAQGKLPLAGAQ